MTAFCPSNGKASGRIVLAKDFDLLLGTGSKVYMNVGANQGVKVGDYFRAVRTYEADLRDPVDSLSFKASTTEDTQKYPPSIEGHMFTKTKGPSIQVADMPRRAVGRDRGHQHHSDNRYRHDCVRAGGCARRRQRGTRSAVILLQ